MSTRVKFWIVSTVILIHAALFLTLGRARALPRAHRIPPRATPNFAYDEDVVENPKTGERTVYREIRVSTKLADPATLPPPPVPASTP